MKPRPGVATLIAVMAASGLAACGSSASSSSTSTQLAGGRTSTESSTASTPAAPTHAKKKAKPKKKAVSHTQTTTTTSTTTAPTTSTTTSTTTTSTTHSTTTTTHKKKTPPAVPAIAALPGPVVSGSSGGAKVSFHGTNHSPKIGVKWLYMVEATNSKGQPLTGTILTEFALNGTVVGKENPPTHHLTNGVLSNKITFPAASKGIALTVHVVVTTPDGTVTLDWPVKSVT